jgi:hypothetical protein
MLGTTKLRARLRRSLLKSGVSGEITLHEAKKNVGAIKLLMKHDVYATFGIREVHQAIKSRKLTRSLATEIMATSLGISVERFKQRGPGFIEPTATANALAKMMDAIDEAISRDELILIATAHPGSMMSYYLDLADYIRMQGGQVYETPKPFLIAPYRWFDAIRGVHVLTDTGILHHTHDAEGFWRFIDAMPEKPQLVLADHGYAGAALNHGIKTAAIHDVDDPGIAVAAYLGLDIIAIPMNDNQLNIPTVAVIKTLLSDKVSE